MRNEDGGRDERVTTNIDTAVLTELEYALQVTLVLVDRRKWTYYDEELFFRGYHLSDEFRFSLLVVMQILHILRHWDGN
jgi:hypothetical protein